VLFGYGNYAKNIILPQVKSYLNLRCIHEIDPLQIPQQRSARYAWSTSPDIAEHERYDVFLIAGFHHTHAPLACKALQHGADVLIEKPVAVDQCQLDDLVTAMLQSNGRVFCCFHKRYQKFNEMAREDLRAQPGDPIHYHCIVYEAPLPAYHWYRWPNSRSRFITNGCHWLDHFLLLNNYAKAASWAANVSPDKTAVNCSVRLINGAYFTMVMTYQGSERIGPQDYIELRANGRTVQIVNESNYIAESKRRILRRYGENRMKAYAQMYRRISMAIARGETGDSIESVKGAVELGLRLEESAAVGT
jgi:predicted dehydrogenase